MDKTLNSLIPLFIVWFISLSLVALLSFQVLPKEKRHSMRDFFQSLANWDGGHYLGIAEGGYKNKLQYAFFPLYPLVIRELKQATTLSFLTSGLLVSFLSTILSFWLLLKLLKLDLPGNIAEKALFLMVIFPTSFYFLIVYSESLFLFLAVGCFYFARQNKLFWATLLALLASATRLAGLALILGLWTEVLFGVGFKKGWITLFAPAGFLFYSLYLNSQTGDPLYFLVAEQNWQRSLSLPFFPFWQTLEKIFTPGYFLTDTFLLIDLFFAIFGLGLALRSLRILRHSYGIYCLSSVVIPLLSSSLGSLSRYLVVVFPIFILVASVKSRILLYFYQLLTTLLLAIFISLFINGYFVS